MVMQGTRWLFTETSVIVTDPGQFMVKTGFPTPLSEPDLGNGSLPSTGLNSVCLWPTPFRLQLLSLVVAVTSTDSIL